MNKSIRSPRRRKMDEYYDIKLINQIFHVSSSLQNMLEFSRDTKLILESEKYIYDLDDKERRKNIDFYEMQYMEFQEDCFVTELNEFFTTLKKSGRLQKYNLKFTIEPKNSKKNKND